MYSLGMVLGEMLIGDNPFDQSAGYSVLAWQIEAIAAGAEQGRRRRFVSTGPTSRGPSRASSGNAWHPTRPAVPASGAPGRGPAPVPGRSAAQVCPGTEPGRAGAEVLPPPSPAGNHGFRSRWWACSWCWSWAGCWSGPASVLAAGPERPAAPGAGQGAETAHDVGTVSRFA